ncbi:hypothetical protein MC378_07850 [Polaribacter sp. MSW13]|uniref:Uncharacterized protein n=1 Tax=Polaribacter marinus TaxID=2916838 RepID=A0A9X2AJ14_9FLAO|nr:hypothetical protein [Polaribacter marinus]MCI2229076.1 hypothetical protein [Polaribacter marinus]
MSRKKIITIGIVILVQTISLAQALPPPAPPPPPPGLPIDGFSGILIVIGLFYGINKILKNSSS